MADLAALAQSLKDNEAFQEALNIIDKNARDVLTTVSLADVETFYRNQAIVKVVDELRANLEQFIRSGKAPKPPGIA